MKRKEKMPIKVTTDWFSLVYSGVIVYKEIIKLLIKRKPIPETMTYDYENRKFRYDS